VAAFTHVCMQCHAMAFLASNSCNVVSLNTARKRGRSQRPRHLVRHEPHGWVPSSTSCSYWHTEPNGSCGSHEHSTGPAVLLHWQILSVGQFTLLFCLHTFVLQRLDADCL
jgi:hypothetical protein